MNDREQQDRLSRITTQWTVMLAAHGVEDGAESIRGELALRYVGAVYYYLLGAVHSADTAEELCQEFAARFLEGRFKNIDPERGRFRDYVKRVLANLIRDHYSERKKWPKPLAVGEDTRILTPDDAAQSDQFNKHWREELLTKTWHSLQEHQPKYYAILRARIEQPELTSRELADCLATSHEMHVTAAYVRKTLERAHHKYSDLLVEEVARSLDCAPESLLVREELEALDLLKYCGEALQRRNARSR